MGKINKYLAIAVGILLLLVILFVAKSNRLDNTIVSLKERINIQEEILKQSEDARKVAEANFITTVAEKDKEISKWKVIVDKNAIQINDGDKAILRLKEELARLNPAEKDAIIFKQKDLISVLEGNLQLAYTTISAKDGIIGAWESKYTVCDHLVTALQDENTKLRGLNDTLKALNKSLESRLSMSGMTGKVKTGLIVGAIGYIAYSILKR
jgi:protein involved in sex pheromone biosynthesis